MEFAANYFTANIEYVFTKENFVKIRHTYNSIPMAGNLGKTKNNFLPNSEDYSNVLDGFKKYKFESIPGKKKMRGKK